MSKNKIVAVLGPTNTGKTFLAIETMLSFDSGMMGFPLRLLAREVYDKVVKKIDPSKVALITGEEKIIPSNAKYFFCTVESMPIDKRLEFVAVDEIQMASDHERGHIFTDRLLNLRGEKLTMFMGSSSMKNIINKLEEDIEYIDRQRLSKLTYSGHKKISRIERKSAIIAFSAEEVYAIAELIRRQKGGAAIVMGSLSPKTRNSQVELYQSGDVDYLVATDAIGMGINMDLDNVYFSNLKKFDGKKLRRLKISEIGQISGRAGRYLNDGYFGITGDCGEISAEEVELLENHKFDDIHTIYWRNINLNFKNGNNLIKSLEERPNKTWLKRIPECEDEKVLKHILKDVEKLEIFNNENELKLLWECCQIPDFVKKTYGNHLEVVGKVFNFLREKPGRVSNIYMKQQLTSLDKLEGNVDSISNRIANVRTWSYISNKINWVENQDYWVERTKKLEDKLSDRLHDELIKSFIDKRASVLARGLKQDIMFETEIVNDEMYIVGYGSNELWKKDLEGNFILLGNLDADAMDIHGDADQLTADNLTAVQFATNRAHRLQFHTMGVKLHLKRRVDGERLDYSFPIPHEEAGEFHAIQATQTNDVLHEVAEYATVLQEGHISRNVWGSYTTHDSPTKPYFKASEDGYFGFHFRARIKNTSADDASVNVIVCKANDSIDVKDTFILNF